MIKELTENDRKVLKNEKRIGYVFSGIIMSFGAFFNLFYFLLNKSDYDFLMLGIIDAGTIGLAYFVCNRINLKVNRDLKDNSKELLKRKLEKKAEEKSYEVGSGALYIPFLGDLWPKLWGQKMKETKKHFIVSNDYKHEVDLKTYNDLETGTNFFIHFANHSGTILSFSKEE